MKSILSSLFVFLSITLSAVNVSLVMKQVDNGGLVSGNTFRLYALVNEPGASVHSVFGNAAHPLAMNTSTFYYQNALGGYASKNTNAALINMFPELAFDSWVTIGYSNSTGNSMSDVGINFFNFEAGSALQANNGSWFLLPTDAACTPDAENLVLLAQFTSTGNISGSLNLQGWLGPQEPWQEFDLPFNSDDAILLDDALVVDPGSYGGASFDCHQEFPIIYPELLSSCENPQFTYEIIHNGFVDCEESVDVAWTITDDCGNTATWIQNFILRDMTSPFAGEMEYEFFLTCGEEIPLVAPLFMDNCDNDLDVWYEISDYGNLVYVSWAATDDCENYNSVVFTYHFDCCAAPVVTSATPQLYIECPEVLPTPETPEFFSDSEIISIEHYEETEIHECFYSVHHHWVATNACGQSGDAYQEVFLIDNTDPSYPEDTQLIYTIGCDDPSPSPPVFTDNCDESLTIIPTTTPFEGGYTIEWYVHDDCYNWVNVTYTIYTQCCGTPEVVNVPETDYYNCGELVLSPSTPVFVDAFDNDLEIIHDSIIENIICGYVIHHHWVATNDCGAEGETFQDIFVYDWIAPTFDGVQQLELTLSCNSAYPEPPVFSDNCDDSLEVEVTTFALEDGIQISYLASDDCGNSAVVTHILHINCCTNPFLVQEPADIFVGCDDEIPTPSTPWFDDYNDIELEVEHWETTEQLDCGYIIHHTWEATNDCELSTMASLDVVVQDNNPPFVDDNGSYEFYLGCNDTLPAPPSFQDNCDDNLSIYSQYFNNDEGAGMEWSAVDDCGNIFTVIYTFYFTCCDNPMLMEIPADLFVECGDEMNDPATPLFTDPMDEELYITHDIVMELMECGYVLHHTWTATNDCGLSADASQDIYVTDTQAPEFSSHPSDVTIECGDEMPAPVVITASDLCDEDVSVETTVNVISETPCTGSVIEVSYEAIDNCGNAAHYSYTITIEDNEEPIIENCPEDIFLACNDAIPAAPVVTAYDSCDENVEILLEEYSLGNGPQDGASQQCDLLTPIRPANNPCVYPVDWAMSLFALPKAHRYYYVSEGQFTHLDNGSIQLTATLNNVYSPANGWNITLTFGNEMTWNQWSTQNTPRTFKADCGGEGTHHAEWLYYLLQNTAGSEMVGFGGYSGSSMNTTHSPSNNYFGFQWGDGANNYNGADNGFGGWFRYTGTFMVNGAPYGANGSISGSGDLAFELDCCPDYTLVRQWTAVDCAGNSTTCIQEIHVGGNNELVNPQNMPTAENTLTILPSVLEISVSPNPANHMTVFRFNTITEALTTLEVISITGEKVAVLMNANAEAGLPYSFDYDTSVLASGVYVYRLSNGEHINTGRLVVTH